MKTLKFTLLSLLFLLQFTSSLQAQDECGILETGEITYLDCDGLSSFCLDVAFFELSSNYNIYVNDNEYSNGISGCEYDTTIRYDLNIIISLPGPFYIDSLIVNDTLYSSGIINTFDDVLDTLISWPLPDIWQIHPNNIGIVTNISENDYSTLYISNIDGVISNISINQYATPIKTSISLPPGNHFIELENTQTNCIDTLTLQIDPPEPFLLDSIIVSEETCVGNNASISVFTSGSIGDLVYSWDNQIGDVDTSYITDITNGTYHVTITDTEQCTQLVDSVIVSGPLDYSVLAIEASCQEDNGQAEVILNTPIINPIFAWSNGDTTQIVSDLAGEWYSVTVTNDNGCTSHKNIEVPIADSCFVIISGTIHLDTIAPDCLTGGEFGDSNIKVKLYRDSELIRIRSPYQDGYYFFKEEPGNYTIKVEKEEEDGFVVCPATSEIEVIANSFAGVYDENDFYTQSDIPNVSLSVYASPTRSNVHQTIYVFFENGTPYEVHDVVVDLYFDPMLAYIQSSSSTAYDDMEHKVSVTLPSLAPLERGSFYTILDVPISIPLGTILSYSANISISNTENSLDDNSRTWEQPVRNSFDPNNKIGFPEGIGEQNIISPTDSILTYRINFQNTGNDTAYVVVLKDSIDTSVFNLTSIKTLASSHEFEEEVIDGNVLTYTFRDINLPDSTTNFEASNGFVIFEIDLKKNLPLETVLNNQAAIFFDYNSPIITNTTLHTIDEISSTRILLNTISTIHIAPNPTKGDISINYTLSKKSVIDMTIYDSFGIPVKQLIQNQVTQAGNHQINSDCSNLPAGLYFLKINAGHQVYTKKIIILK